MSEAAIETEGLKKRFGTVEAVKGVDLQVEAGTVMGLLGPNGAGKTTTVRILTTLLRADGGRASVAGFDVAREPQKVRAAIGLTGQYAAVDEILTGRENLQLVGRLLHLGKSRAKQRAAELLERFDLTDAADRPARTYSGGMRRRLDLAASLIGAPTVLFLDEPTTGLDPLSRIELWKVIAELVTEGTTLLLTTQYLEEADRLANRVAVIDRGTVIAEGTSTELKRKIGGDVLELTLGDRTQASAAVAAVKGLANGEPHFDERTAHLAIPVAGGAAVVPEAVRALDAASVAIEDIALRRPTLDDVFFALTGHGAEDAPSGPQPKVGR